MGRSVWMLATAFAAYLSMSAAPTAYAQEERSQFVDGIAVGSVWQDVTASEGNHLRVDYQIVAFSGGGTKNGRTVVFGGGHNNGMSDAVAFLDWRRFETVGWTEELMSTADLLGVGDKDYEQIGQYLNDNYSEATPGGIFDSRGYVALSRHTYDQVVVLDDHFYLFSGALPFDNVGQPRRVWEIEEDDIWRYDFGQGWTFIDDPLRPEHAAAAYDSRTGDIWIHDGSGLRLFDTETEQLGSPRDTLRSQAIESFMNFNPEKGSRGTLFGAGQYAAGGDDWHEYDIATGRERNMGPVPGNVVNTYIIYVPAAYGDDYGTYFAFVPADGTLRKWNGNGWDVIATGGPSNDDYVYGRVGFEEVHQVFYWIHNPFSGNDDWQTFVVRPYPFAGSVEPTPVVNIDAIPDEVPEQGTSTLSWSSTYATSCTASGDWAGTKALTGSELVGPLENNTSYTLTCSGAGGTAADAASVTVLGTQPVPTVTISANPSAVDSGGFAVVDWMSTDAESCEAQCDWSGTKPVQGSESFGPISADVQLCMTCSGLGGSASNSVVVTVNASPPPPPPPPPPPVNNSGGSGSVGPTMIFLLATMSGLLPFRRG